MNSAEKLPPHINDGTRMVLHSPYGQIIISRGPIIKNGHQGTIIDARQGLVKFDGAGREVTVPEHCIKILKENRRA